MELNEILAKLNALPEEEKAEVVKQVTEATSDLLWIPSPGPQTEAYFSKADILLYGGEPGGGKTALLLGLAFMEHQRSLILRRQYTDLGAITSEAIRINGTRKGFNGSPPPSLQTRNGQLIEFGAAARVGDEEHWQGNPHDFIGFDEGTQFAESQIRFLIGWLRSVDPTQRSRVVIASNPPLSSEGAWVVEMFAPWLDDRHPNPAAPGELRWFVSDNNDKDIEVQGPEPVEIGGMIKEPLSRTYIPAAMSDNPYLAATDYKKRLDNLPGYLREVLMGGFMHTFRDATNQCIPTDWIRQAQQRWREHPRPPIGVPMCAMGVDVAQGGTDETVIAMRYDDWFAPLEFTPGSETPTGSDVAGLVIKHRRDNAVVVIDMGGGYGGATFERLQDNLVDVVSYKGAKTSTARTRDQQLKFTNIRTKAYWRLREALDPSQEGGATIMLPDDPKLTADLAAPTFEVTPGGIKLEKKEDVCRRLGRSTDAGDAVVMCWTAGSKFLTDGGEWIEKRDRIMRKGKPRVLMGRKHYARRRR